MGPGRTQAREKHDREEEMKKRQQSILTTLVSLNAGILLFAGFVAFPHLSHAYGDADAERGKQLFEKRCTGCHSLDQNKEGPHLRGVYGRHAGRLPGFTYSAALQS